jgi:hypothetical protein
MKRWSDIRKKYFKPLDEPWVVLKDRPFHFVAWVLVVPGVGLAGFWLPLALAYARGEPVAPICSQLLISGTTASVCVAILAEGLLGVLTAEKTGTNVPALGLRGIAGGMATLLIILLVGTMSAESARADGPHLRLIFHLILTFIALFAAAYLY